MALVTYVLGDCPDCKAKDAFGNVDVYGTYVFRGCKRCRYSEDVDLPTLRKKVIYLDQFFFSHAFRGGDKRFVTAAERIARLASLQVVAAPFSSIHEDETHQWAKRAELLAFIKNTARGHEFERAYSVEQAQIIQSFQTWFAGGDAQCSLEPNHAISDELHVWDSYTSIDVSRYMGDVELIRDLKKQSVEGLVNLFDGWRTLETSFEDDLMAEYQTMAKGYMYSFLEFTVRVARGDVMAMLDAPIMSQVVKVMLNVIATDDSADQKLTKCAEYLISDHFKQLPYQWLHAHMLATLKHLVKSGFYKNRELAMRKLNGFFYDVKHIATYAPYVDAFVMDQPMADLVSRPTVNLESRFGTKVFSLSNWDVFLAWLDQLEDEISTEHREGLRLAYPTKV